MTFHIVLPEQLLRLSMPMDILNEALKTAPDKMGIQIIFFLFHHESLPYIVKVQKICLCGKKNIIFCGVEKGTLPRTEEALHGKRNIIRFRE